MPSSVHLLAHIWAIDPDASLRYTPAAAPAWRRAPGLSACAITLAPCPSRPSVLVACADGSIHAFHPSAGTLQSRSPTPLHARPLCLHALPAEDALFVGLADGAVVRLHLSTLAFDCMLGCGVEHSAAVHALDADDTYLYSAGADAVVLVWDLSNANAVREISMPSAPVRSMLRVRHSLWLGLADGSVEVLDIFGDHTNGISRAASARPHERPVTALVRVGDTRVWSVADVPSHADLAAIVAAAEQAEAAAASATNDNALVVSSASPSSSAVAAAITPNVAVWDTRDFTYTIPDDLPHPFLQAVTVLSEHPYTRVTVLTLTPQLEPHFHLETVPAAREAVVEEDPENEALHAYIHDLEQQLDHAAEELHYLRAAAVNNSSSTVSQQHPGDSDPRPSTLINMTSHEANPASPIADPLRSPSLTNSQHHTPGYAASNSRSPNMLVVDAANQSTRAAAAAAQLDPSSSSPAAGTLAPPVIPHPIYAHLEATLATLADLLVTLLTEDVLSSETVATASSPSPTPNTSTVRHAVAAITQELNAAKELLDSCATSAPSQDPTMQESPSSQSLIIGPGGAVVQQNSNAVDVELVQQLRADLEAEREKTRQLQGDLELVTRERDLSIDDLNQTKKQSDSTLTSLQAVLRDNTSTIVEKDELIAALRAECEALNTKWQNERIMREEVESSVKERVDKLMVTAQDTAKTYEDQIKTAYDRIETKAIEIQAQRETMHVAEGKVDELRSVNQQLEEACGDLQMRLQLSGENLDRTNKLLESERKKLTSLAAAKENAENENKNLEKRFRELNGRYNETEERLKSSRSDIDRVRKNAADDLKSLRDKTNRQLHASEREIAKARAQFERERAERDHDVKRRDARIIQLQTEIENRDRIEAARKGAGENDMALGREQLDAEIKSDQERSDATVAEMEIRLQEMTMRLAEAGSPGLSSIHVDPSSLAEQYRLLSEECELLKEEVEHRKSAALLYEEDSANMSTVISNLRAATEELKETLEGRDEEVRVHMMKIDELRAGLATRDRRVHQLEARLEKVVANESREMHHDVETSGKATRALLASAHGEIEQMSRQMDAMYRAQLAQEKELTTLRKAISARDETIRRRDAALDALRRSISQGLRPRTNDEQQQLQQLKQHAKQSQRHRQAPQRMHTAPPSPPILSMRKDWASSDGGEPVTTAAVAAEAAAIGPGEIGSTSRLDDDGQINATLQQLQEGMVVTQDKLRHLMQLARKCKTLAHSHVEVLPALFELEGELARIMRQEPRKGPQLRSARGIVQSVIAQYYSSREKRTVMSETEEALYTPSEKRLVALHAAVSRLRGVRLSELARDATGGGNEGRRGRGSSGLLAERVGRLADRFTPTQHHQHHHHHHTVGGGGGGGGGGNGTGGGGHTGGHGGGHKGNGTPGEGRGGAALMTKRLLSF